MRSNVPEDRSRCMVIEVIRNITNSGNSPSRIRHAVWKGETAPGGNLGTSSNMKYISVITALGTTRIIATLRWSARSWRRMRPVVAR